MKEIMEKARSYAASKGYKQVADDFAQEAAIKLAQGRKASLRQLWVDFLRDTYGKSAYQRNKVIRAMETQYSDIESAYDIGQEPTALDTVAWDWILKGLEFEERTMLILMFEWGLTLKEVGRCFDLSEGRMCQKFNELKVKLRKRGKIPPGGVA